jgi:hypothetical protein
MPIVSFRVRMFRLSHSLTGAGTGTVCDRSGTYLPQNTAMSIGIPQSHYTEYTKVIPGYTEIVMIFSRLYTDNIICVYDDRFVEKPRRGDR